MQKACDGVADTVRRFDDDDVGALTAREVGAEDGSHHIGCGLFGHDAVHRAEVLLDVHGDPIPNVAIGRIGAKPYVDRVVPGKRRRHDSDTRAGAGHGGRDAA